MSTWNAYKPSDAMPWDLKRVVHLHRRAAFGAGWNVIQRDLREGPEASIGRVLRGATQGFDQPAGSARQSRDAGDSATPQPRSPTEPVLSDPTTSSSRLTPQASLLYRNFESTATVIGNAAVDSGSADRLKAWWLYRCLFSPHPLAERLTLMWHNHFATSNLKVNDLRLMKQQNETFRRLAFAPFGELLSPLVHDPALLEWLDAPSNHKQHPNENLARELMELFTLGIGHYSERDVKEGARALTGWTVRQGEFRSPPAAHDDETKTILGRTGNFNGDDLVTLLIAHPATAHRLAWRLTGEFFGEGVVDDSGLRELADGLRQHNLDIRWGVETILCSQLFFSEKNIGTRLCDPVSFLLGPLKALECEDNPPSTLILAEWIARMGQDLFHPPNVGGWPGGRAWLSTRTVVARANGMAALIAGLMQTPPRPLNLASLAAKHANEKDVRSTVRFLSRLFFGRVDDAGLERIVRERESEAQLSHMAIDLLTGPQAHLH